MPRNLHTESRTDAIVATVSSLICAGGMAAVTTRAIAAGTGISIAWWPIARDATISPR